MAPGFRALLVAAAVFALAADAGHDGHELAKDDGTQDDFGDPASEERLPIPGLGGRRRPRKRPWTSLAERKDDGAQREEGAKGSASGDPSSDRAAREPPRPASPEEVPRELWLEAIGICILVVYILTWWLGSRANLRIATAWERACAEVFDQNFSLVGGNTHTSRSVPGSLLTQEAQHYYKLLARGRANCISCQAHLELAKRQDALSAYFLFAFNPGIDVCRMELTVESMDLMTFCICRQTEIKTIAQNKSDLREFARPRKAEELAGTQLCVLSDSAEAVHAILQPNVVRLLKQCEDFVQTLHVSDIMDGDRKGIHGEFRLPAKPTDMQAAASLVSLCLYLVDVAGKFQHSEKSRKTVQDARHEAQKVAEADKRVQQEQRMQQKKIEKNKQEASKTLSREEASKTLSREEQRKREEKEYKKSLKSRMPKMKMTRS